ncbi:MAG TPA: hypothetical protein VHY58_09230, partial [Streptosporangiaceae bacterium]|nr:hypothetical protein [Streptosporangiaceae bacterium]
PQPIDRLIQDLAAAGEIRAHRLVFVDRPAAAEPGDDSAAGGLIQRGQCPGQGERLVERADQDTGT